MFDRENGFHLKTILLLLVIGFIGMFFCFLFFEENYFEMSRTGQILSAFFISVWILTLIVIVPVQILYFRQKNRYDSSLQKATAGDYLGLFFGAFNPDAKLPKWISIPVLGFLWLLISIIVMGIALAIISFCVEFLTGNIT
jgi:hypothetical protein